MYKLSPALVGMFLTACGGAQSVTPATPETSTAEPAQADDALPDGATVVLEAPHATVTRFELTPGKAQRVHDGPDRVIYSLSDYNLAWTEGDAAPVQKSWTAGDVHWHEAGPHAAQNVGDGVARYLVVARNAGPLPTVEGSTEPEVTAGGHGEVLLENDAVRVVEVSLEPGESIPSHMGGYRVIYSLDDYTIRWTEGDAEAKDVTWTAGEAHWHEPGPHQAENVGDTPARYLVVTFRR